MNESRTDVSAAGTARLATPEEVERSSTLTLEEKVDLLYRWAYDAAEEEVAEEEGMPGRGSDLLQRVLLALHRLTGGLDVEHVGPTKQHGLPAPALRSVFTPPF